MRYAGTRLVATVLMLALGSAALADDFRIETKVYSGKVKAPVSENVTLFDGGTVYDYLSDPERIAVFDPHGRFIVLDPKRKVKAEVKTEDVRRFADVFRESAKNSTRPFMKFAAAPDFQIETTEKGDLTLSSEFVTYRVETTPAHSPQSAQQYREFCDWYVRFNAMATPGAMPPFPRMAVNAELAERGLVPTEVQLTIPAAPGLKAVALRSEHNVSWRLLPKDHKKIAETGHQLATFKAVDFDKFEPEPIAKRPKIGGPKEN